MTADLETTIRQAIEDARAAGKDHLSQTEHAVRAVLKARREKRPARHTIIPPGMTITGSLSSPGDVHVEGKIDGDITCRELTLTGRPMIKGSIKADTVRIGCAFDGQVQAKKVALTMGARVTGYIDYETLELEPGASFEG